jgi:hypothetical protein
MYGSAYGFFRTSGLDAADPFARVLLGDTLERVKPPSNRQQFGGTIGGAIRPNQTFFFGSFEGLRRRESNSVSVLTDRLFFIQRRSRKRFLPVCRRLSQIRSGNS